jgi:hypothetical protein
MHRVREDSSVIRCMNFLTMSGALKIRDQRGSFGALRLAVIGRRLVPILLARFESARALCGLLAERSALRLDLFLQLGRLRGNLLLALGDLRLQVGESLCGLLRVGRTLLS